MVDDSIFLRKGGDIVGFAKYVFVSHSITPSQVIHEHSLGQFAKKRENLVAVHSVQIFKEFEAQKYPYCYKGFEDPPVLLGDLNKIEKAFKHIIAWDRNKVVPNPCPSITTLGSTPQVVSVHSISLIRESLIASPTKVRFSEQGKRGPAASSSDSRNTREVPKTRYCSVLRTLMASDPPKHDGSSASSHHSPADDSVDEFVDEPDLEEKDSFRGILGLEEHANKDRESSIWSSRELFEESVDQFELELDAEEEEVRAASRNVDERTSSEGKEELPEGSSSDRSGKWSEDSSEVAESSPRKTRQRSSVPQCQLSPAEKIVQRLRKRKRNLQGKRKSDSDDASSALLQTRRSETTQGSAYTEEEKGDTGASFKKSSVFFCNSNGEDTVQEISYSAGVIQRNENGQDVQERGETTSRFIYNVAPNELNPEELDGTSQPGGGQNRRDRRDVLLPVARSLKKRIYRFNKRVKADSKVESRFRLRCVLLVQQSYVKNPFEMLKECCNSACFDEVNPGYAVVQYRRILMMDRAEKKRALRSMYNAETNEFWFDGSRVCSRFLCKGFLFSNQLQSAVKATPGARASASIIACPRDSNKETKKNAIIVYLRNLAERIGNFLPTKSHINLPLLTKTQVYERFRKWYELHHCDDAPCKSYFCDVWVKHCPHINTHRHHGFTVCGTCEKIRAGFATNESDKVQELLRKQMEEHYALMDEERRGYEVRRNLSKAYPEKYCSIIVDGADQKSYGLPHYVFNTKDEKGHKLKVRCIGVLQHGSEKHLSLYTLTEEFESGANHVIEAVHRVLNEKKKKDGKLPEVLFVQADNCTRENKNHFFMAYFQMLVANGVFLEVQISFLPIGHTHADIDQCFSSVANRLRLVDAITIEDMLGELRNCYTPRASAEEMSNVVNFSGLCKSLSCLFKVKGFSKYRYFRFTRRNTSGSDSEVSEASTDCFLTTCDVKVQGWDEWIPLDESRKRNGFLKVIPNLEDLPETDTTPPDNVLEVNKNIRSCESRMKNAKNIRRLEALRDRVYTRRVDAPHWDVASIFELQGDYRESSTNNCDASAAINESCEQIRLEQLSYSLSFYLAVKTEDNCVDPFWIARTLWIAEKDEDGNPLKLKIRWYQARVEQTDAFSATYAMSTYVRHGERISFDDVVDVRSVLCEFESLTSKGGLPSRTQKAIRQCLGME